MYDHVRIITHRGHKIISVDTSGLRSADIAALHPILTKTAIDHKVNLICTSNSYDTSVRRSTQASIAQTRATLGKIHSAIIGIGGIRKLLANAMQKDHYFASNREDALDWLVKQADH